MLAPMILFLIGLLASLALVPVLGLMDNCLTDRRGLKLLIGSAIVLGYVVGGTTLWWFVPAGWRLSFGDTLAASVNAQKYGHPIEHYAESILALMLCACVAGAAAGGVLAAVTARLLRRPRHA